MILAFRSGKMLGALRRLVDAYTQYAFPSRLRLNAPARLGPSVRKLSADGRLRMLIEHALPAPARKVARTFYAPQRRSRLAVAAAISLPESKLPRGSWSIFP